MFNMDGTSHMATQRHETTVAQKIKQLAVTASSECEQNMTGFFANNASGFHIASVRNYSRKITKKNPHIPRNPVANYCSVLSEESLALHQDVL
jgi:hypothetical protein